MCSLDLISYWEGPTLRARDRDWIRGLNWCVWATLGGVVPVAAVISESMQAAGLVYSVSVAPTGVVKVLSIGLTGDEAAALNSLVVTVADLASSTGLETGDLGAFRLYTSLDTVLDTSADTLLSTALLDSIGASVALISTTTHVPPARVERFYLVAAVVDSTAVDHRAFTVSLAAGGLATSRG